jgi:hypothetical protein
MGVIPFRGGDGKKYIEIDRKKTTSVRGWTTGAPQLYAFGVEADSLTESIIKAHSNILSDALSQI